MNPWIAFAIGVFVGGIFGIVIMCLMHMASIADDSMMPNDREEDA